MNNARKPEEIPGWDSEYDRFGFRDIFGLFKRRVKPKSGFVIAIPLEGERVDIGVIADLRSSNGSAGLTQTLERYAGKYRTLRINFNDIYVDSSVPAQLIDFANRNPDKRVEVRGNCRRLLQSLQVNRLYSTINSLPNLRFDEFYRGEIEFK